jgi:hypothetical protein
VQTKRGRIAGERTGANKKHCVPVPVAWWGEDGLMVTKDDFVFLEGREV